MKTYYAMVEYIARKQLGLLFDGAQDYRTGELVEMGAHIFDVSQEKIEDDAKIVMNDKLRRARIDRIETEAVRKIQEKQALTKKSKKPL